MNYWYTQFASIRNVEMHSKSLIVKLSNFVERQKKMATVDTRYFFTHALTSKVDESMYIKL